LRKVLRIGDRRQFEGYVPVASGRAQTLDNDTSGSHIAALRRVDHQERTSGALVFQFFHDFSLLTLTVIAIGFIVAAGCQWLGGLSSSTYSDPHSLRGGGAFSRPLAFARRPGNSQPKLV
jgi:hypothetical protein